MDGEAQKYEMETVDLYGDLTFQTFSAAREQLVARLRNNPRLFSRLPKPIAAAAPKRGMVAAQQARANGFALDLSHGGPDADDAKFQEYA